jgi:hypothetical protein
MHKHAKFETAPDSINDRQIEQIKINAAKIQAKIEEQDAERTMMETALRILQEEWREGKLDVSKNIFEDQIKIFETEIGRILVNQIVLRTSKFELAGKDVDFDLFQRRENAKDMGYLDLLMMRFSEPSDSQVTMKQPRNMDQQARWRKELFKAYDVIDDRTDEVWCPISKTWYQSRDVAAAHIVRHNITDAVADNLFGEKKGGSHIWSLQNGIPILKAYEEMMDDAKIAIVPAPDGENLRVKVLDPKVLEAGSRITSRPVGHALDGCVLEFRTTHRPSRRYLYFNFAMSVLRRQRYEVPGWWRDCLSNTDTQFFATPGPWVRVSTLHTLARRIGHLVPEETDAYLAALRVENQPSPTRGSRKGKEVTAEKEAVAADTIHWAYHNISIASTPSNEWPKKEDAEEDDVNESDDEDE